MYYEIAIIALIIFVIMISTGQISINQLISDHEALFKKLKESDWDFYVKARYGNDVNPDILFNQRIRNGVITIFAMLFAFIGNFSAITIVIAIAAGFFMYKMTYMNVKSYYRKHINEIDSMLPHYLKSIEILIQHYTVPVAIGKSLEDAPEIFKEGLQDLVNAINSGDDSINPYMDFAKTYPVRDSMRMMRLLYRLSIGRQERKQEQLLAFSKSISNLQQKARETRYKNRLEKMEGMTMRMLICTGIGVMVLLILSVLQMIDL
ncbi:MAG: hypothetical protein E7164_04040 [Firmicutes bacterium]|nr:hypothetical protein [Bacillota bacterium]